MKRGIAAIPCALLASALAGCATLTTGRYQSVDLLVRPSGSELRVYDWEGTPVARRNEASTGTLELRRRGDSLVVVATREGHCPVYWLTEVEEARMFRGNVMFAFLGVLPAWAMIAVDATTGAMYEVRPRSFVTVLPEDSECGG